MLQLRCRTAREGHLFRKFGWGNRKSLVEDPATAGIDVRQELLQYYRCVFERVEGARWHGFGRIFNNVAAAHPVI